MARGTRDLRRAVPSECGKRDGSGRGPARELELDVLRCDTWELLSMSPITFFAAYAGGGYAPSSRSAGAGRSAPAVGSGGGGGEGVLLKLKDYPPAASFAEVLTRHNQVRSPRPRCGCCTCDALQLGASLLHAKEAYS
jgi:hypothetical protein